MKKNERLKNRPVGRFIKSGWRWSPLAVFALAVAIMVQSCGQIKHLPTETTTQVNLKDSTILHIKDSIRYHEATRYKDMAWLGDTLKIEGSRSSAWAFADTTRECLTGGLEEKPYEERTKIIFKDRWKVRDSLVYKEVPVEVEKPVEVIKIPWIFKFLSAVGLISIIGLIIFLFVKIKGFGLPHP